MGERAWVKEISKQLREDMGDCPTLPKEMLDLLRKLDRLEAQKTAGREKAVEQDSGRGGASGVLTTISVDSHAGSREPAKVVWPDADLVDIASE